MPGLIGQDQQSPMHHTDPFISGHAKSSIRLQITQMRQKQTELEKQLAEREQELAKLKEKTSDEAKMKAREELARALNVLKHVKKRAGAGCYDVEYAKLVEEIQLMQREGNHSGVREFKVEEQPKIEPEKKEQPQKADEKERLLQAQDQEISELMKKVKDLEDELALPTTDFERKLTERLREEIKVNKAQLDEEFSRELKQEKRRILTQAQREKDELKMENKQLSYEIQRLKILLRHGGGAQLALIEQQSQKQ